MDSEAINKDCYKLQKGVLYTIFIGSGNKDQAAYVLAWTIHLAIYCLIDFQFDTIDLIIGIFWPFSTLKVVITVLHLN